MPKIHPTLFVHSSQIKVKILRSSSFAASSVLRYSNEQRAQPPYSNKKGYTKERRNENMSDG